MARALRIVLSLAAPLPRQALDSSTGSPWACLTSSMIRAVLLVKVASVSQPLARRLQASACFAHAPVHSPATKFLRW